MRRIAAVLLLALGTGALGWSGLAIVQAAWVQHVFRPEAGGTRAPSHPAAAGRSVPRRGDVVGTIEVPRLGISSIVLEGDDPATLAKAVGHLADTPWPWQEGNAAFAAHRDSFFRPLERIRRGDLIRVATAAGDFDYLVEDAIVVSPTDLWVLDPTARPALTLITCYPFRYVGAAPQRFVVRAVRRQL